MHALDSMTDFYIDNKKSYNIITAIGGPHAP